MTKTMEDAIKDSNLFKLPRELRDSIYEFCFTGDFFTVDRKDIWHEDDCDWPEDDYDDPNTGDSKDLDKILPKEVPLLSICRLLRNEALPILFKCIYFVIKDDSDLTPFHFDVMRWPEYLRSKVTTLRFCEPLGVQKSAGDRYPAYCSFYEIDDVFPNLGKLKMVLNNCMLFPHTKFTRGDDPQDYKWDDAHWILETWMTDLHYRWHIQDLKIFLLDLWESAEKIKAMLKEWKGGGWANFEEIKFSDITYSDYPCFFSPTNNREKDYAE